MLRRWLPLFAIVALLGAALAAAALAEPQISIAPLERSTPTRDAQAPQQPTALPELSAPPPPEASGGGPTLPGWIDTVITVFCVLLVVAIVVALVWYLVRDTIQARGRPIDVDEGAAVPPGPRADEVAAAVDAGLAELADTDRDPRRAVIACWVRLEQAATEAGTPRKPSDAPGDYVLRLLSTQAVSRQVLDRFAGVYRLARYGTGPVDESMRQTAVAALRQLRTELTAPAGDQA